MNNEYKTIDEFISQYTGEWGPSEGHWYGLDFVFNGVKYRFNTGSMYNEEDTILPDGRTAVFGIYQKRSDENNEPEYNLLGEFATIEDALKSTCIEGKPFSSVIMDESTQFVGQD